MTEFIQWIIFGSEIVRNSTFIGLCIASFLVGFILSSAIELLPGSPIQKHRPVIFKVDK